MIRRLILALFAGLALTTAAMAQDVAAPDQPLADPQAEARAQRLFGDSRWRNGSGRQATERYPHALKCLDSFRPWL